MPATADKLITAKEFMEMPDPEDGTQQELVRGEIVSLPMPSYKCVECQAAIAYMLRHYAKTNRAGRVVTETGVRTEKNPDTVRGPDVAYWSAVSLPLDAVIEGYALVPPDLCVEVLSPSNTPKLIKQKIKEYLFNGTKVVWIVDPEDRSMKIYRSPLESRSLEEDAVLDGDETLPGFTCRVSDLLS